MQHPPAESALYRPPVRQWGESFLAGVLADDLDVDAVRGAALDDTQREVLYNLLLQAARGGEVKCPL